ncbi:type 1 glutamine amidotransferase [Bacillus rubiinfantis]|uniref:type 1 glutamine amidotransferase n=1 Tax=Bacillus rubiinfantis TaxID=1499680 RepID=UPI0005AACA3A|nr:type 1 glutamine amidotransferase [Bacillus rubiinfantis]
MKIHYIQNDELATLGFIDEWVKNNHHQLTATKMYANEALPLLEEFDLLIILGGRMGAYEEEKFPWLIVEKQFIRKAIDAGKKVLGICLGSQLLADVLGGKVYPHTHQEIGWSPIEKTADAARVQLFNGIPQSFAAFQFHGDTFELPPDAIRLAQSRGCLNQAFIYGDCTIGLQFHPEFTEDIISNLQKRFGPELSEGEFIQHPNDWTNQHRLTENAKSILFTILNSLSV